MDVVRLMLPVRALDLVARCLTFNTFFLRTVETDHSTPLSRVCNGTRGVFPVLALSEHEQRNPRLRCT